MKKIKYGLIFGSLIIVILGIACAALLASCNNIFDIPSDQPPTGGYGTVTLNITSGDTARTAFPAIEGLTTTYTFYKEGTQGGEVKEPYTGTSFTLDKGKYDKVVVDIKINSTSVASGTSDAFTVGDSANLEVPIKLTPTAPDTGQGTFEYNITCPTDTMIEINLEKWPTGDGNVLDNSDQATGSKEVDAGTYVLIVTVTGTGVNDGKKAGFVKAVHIYNLMTTNVTHTFNASDLISEATAGGGDTAVMFTDLTADGDYNTPTTTLTLTFSETITGLAATDISLTGATGGSLSGTNPYTLTINDVNAIGTVTVSVTKSGYNIDATSIEPVKVYGGDFVTATGLKTGIETYGDGDHAFDNTTGVLTVTGNGGFSVPLPAGFTVADSVDIKYACLSEDGAAVKFTKKQKDGWTNVTDSSLYPTFDSTGQEATVNVTGFNADGVTNGNAWFQTNGDFTALIKIISITRVPGAAIIISTAVPGLKPVAGETPVLSVDTIQYSGTVSWKDSTDTTVTGNFMAGTTYTATIALTAKTGYTFSGITANTFSVTGATSTTHATGTDTLSITAVFPAAASAAPDLTLSFDDVTVVGRNNVTVSALTGADAGKGFNVVTSAGYEWAFAYFKVQFDTGFKLSDYSKIDFTIKAPDSGLTGDASGYKAGYMMVYATESEISDISQLDDNDHLIFTETPDGGTTGVENLDTAYIRTVTIQVPTGTDLNEVWVAYRVGGVSGYIWELSNIKFYNPAP